MKEFIAYLIKNLVDKPEDVIIEIFEGEKNTVIEVRVAQDDVGKLIGKQGRTIRALRNIVMTVGASPNRKVRLELIQP